MNEYLFSELEIGHKETFTIQITQEMENSFRTITGDINPLHQDDEFAKEISNGKFGQHVAFGMLTASFYSTLAGVYLPGKYSLIHSLDLKFQKPVFSSDILEVSGEIIDKQDDLKLIMIKAKITNQKAQCVSKADMKVIVMK